jgi:hypothetical protein
MPFVRSGTRDNPENCFFVIHPLFRIYINRPGNQVIKTNLLPKKTHGRLKETEMYVSSFLVSVLFATYATASPTNDYDYCDIYLRRTWLGSDNGGFADAYISASYDLVNYDEGSNFLTGILGWNYVPRRMRLDAWVSKLYPIESYKDIYK